MSNAHREAGSFPNISSGEGLAGRDRIIASWRAMFSVLWAVANLIADLFKSHRRLEVENLLLRHQLSVALRQAPARLRLRGIDRAILAGLARLWRVLSRRVQVVRRG